jgi:hypothetical protein
MRRFLSILLFISANLIAQTKGVVKDSLSGNSIPYVSIWVENENIGTTSEENGEFVINVSDKNKNLVFSALGFKKKIVKVSESQLVALSMSAVEIGEILVSNNRKEKNQIEIGKTKNRVAEAFDNGPKMDAKFFQYLPEYKKTSWIKKATITVDSKIEDATIRIQLYGVDANGFPSEELLDKNYIVTLKKGITKQEVDLTEFNLEMPETGVFVVFERLLIEKNKITKVITDYNSNTTKTKISFAPLVLYNAVEKEYLFSFSGGRWIKQSKEELNPYGKSKTIYEPSINLILTN